MAIDKRTLATWLRAELSNAAGVNSGGELTQMRARALDRYYGRATGDEIEGRSAAQSTDIADMLEATIAQLLPGFSGDAVAEFGATSDQDVAAAQLESDAVNAVLLEENPGYVLMQEALRDALLLRNGWVKVWEDESSVVDSQEYRGAPEEALGQLMARDEPAGMKLEYEDIEPSSQGPGLVDFTLVSTRQVERLRVTSVDPSRMSWSANHDSIYLDELTFLAEAWNPTRSQLVAQGYSKKAVYDAPVWVEDGTEAIARYGSTGRGSIGADPSSERVGASWIHYRYDSDGDGVAELHRILLLTGGEGEILSDEIVSFIPYATGSAFLQPHRLDGLGLYDKLRHLEAAKTQILRSWIDNLSVGNNARLAVNTRTVSLEDAVSSRPGGIIRVNGEPGMSITTVPAIDVGASAMAAMNYQDKMRSERAGASLDLQSAQLQIAGDTAHGIERQISSREMMAAMMARTLAETLIRSVYLLVHRGLREWVGRPLTVRRAGAFAQVDPSTWGPRDKVNLKTGLSVGERMQRRMALEAIIGQQEKLAAAGLQGVLVDASGYYAALMDWCRASEIDQATRYFLDPTSEASQQAAQERAAQQEKAQNQQVEIAGTAAAQAQQAALIEQTMGKYKADQETAFKYFEATLKAELEQLKLASADSGDAAELEGLEAMGAARAAGG